MNEHDALKEFANDFLQEVITASDSADEGEFRTNEFTRLACEYLIDAGEVDDVVICYYKARGLLVNGYNISSNEDCLDLFVSVFNQRIPPTSVTKSQVETAFRQAQALLTKAFSGYHTSLEESSPVYDMFQRIFELKSELARVRIYLLTDGLVNSEIPQAETEGDLVVSFQIWDIRRIYRFATSGKKFEPIEIDFQEAFGKTIPCLSLADESSDYRGYLAVVPGVVLAGIYEKFGPRLLERNVRAFLQARGNVNKGIRKTILEEPHRFFAYNNGISATADEIEFEASFDGSPRISKVRNLQIVNGGQTTASLYHTAKKDKVNLDGINVQAKLSVIPPEHLEAIVPEISRCANSQNKVNDADFYANDPYHVRLQELSRTVWTPAAGNQRQTKWFYERARGQYLDAKGREGTPAKRKQFEIINPPKQKFTKTDLAKYENTWMQQPYLVSLGAQKNFIHFTTRLKQRGKFDVDARYFEHLVAKAILFKRAETIIGGQEYGGYRAQIVTYSVALLAHLSSHRIDLDAVWKRQDLSPTLQEAIRKVSAPVHSFITNPPNGRNITEWCKRKECWEGLSNQQITLPDNLKEELIELSHSNGSADKGIDGPDANDLAVIAAVSAIPSDTWFRISKWAKETNNLQPWQRSISFSIGKTLSRSQQISRKQADQGRKILTESVDLGFVLSVE
jgi:hypothetical protein